MATYRYRVRTKQEIARYLERERWDNYPHGHHLRRWGKIQRQAKTYLRWARHNT